MFQSYQLLSEFERQNPNIAQLSVEQKLSILDGMVQYAFKLRPDIFTDDFAGMQEKIDFIKLLHSVQRAAR
ncbi:MAG: hypothetical protein SH857_11595 [Chitinophagales bacterium]|nr:hypothetical protein [Chitinophagales bacterium]